jgi:hypothetical protein
MNGIAEKPQGFSSIGWRRKLADLIDDQATLDYRSKPLRFLATMKTRSPAGIEFLVWERNARSIRQSKAKWIKRLL